MLIKQHHSKNIRLKSGAAHLIYFYVTGVKLSPLINLAYEFLLPPYTR